MNPKKRAGSSKLALGIVPAAAMAHMTAALEDGAKKYGPYNWRDEPIDVSTYLSAISRHMALYSAGEERADDSNVHHLGHVMACCAILLDSHMVLSVIDDRHTLLPHELCHLKELLQCK